jgi:acetate kinase
MGTRCGDIDAGAVTYLMEKEGLDAKGISDYLNKKGGVAGISGLSSDMRDIEAADKAGEPKAVLAMSMYAYRIKKYIGAYTAALGGVDVIVFTGGVGENQTGLRAQICSELAFMGIELDEVANDTKGEEIVITKPTSKVKVVVVPTDEEFMIASDTLELIA